MIDIEAMRPLFNGCAISLDQPNERVPFHHIVIGYQSAEARDAAHAALTALGDAVCLTPQPYLQAFTKGAGDNAHLLGVPTDSAWQPNETLLVLNREGPQRAAIYSPVAASLRYVDVILSYPDHVLTPADLSAWHDEMQQFDPDGDGRHIVDGGNAIDPIDAPSLRFEVKEGSEHFCCFGYTVVEMPNGERVCECSGRATAERVADALNKGEDK